MKSLQVLASLIGPVTELIAKTVIEMVQTGDRARLKDLTIKAIEDINR